MSAPNSTIAEWTKPGTVLAILGWLALAYTSYDKFRETSEKQTQEVVWRVEAIEKKNDEQEIHLKSTDSFVADHGLRIDRLEQRGK